MKLSTLCPDLLRSSHAQRILTAVVLLPLLGFAIYAGGWALFIVAAAVSLLGLWEFYSMFWPGHRGLGHGLGKKLLGLGLAIALLFSVDKDSSQLIMGVLVASFWVGNLFFLYYYSLRPTEANYKNAGLLMGGLLYIPLPLAFLLSLSPVEIILCLAASMVSDTGAYYSGGAFGGRKIWPAISPKKTVAGSIGGLLACVLFTQAYGLAFGVGTTRYIFLGIALNVAAQFGDFFESALKRYAGVKDSGSLLPGHGGILDRIDSILLVIPVYAGLAAITPYF